VLLNNEADRREWVTLVLLNNEADRREWVI